jgi:hypothetical protein
MGPDRVFSPHRQVVGFCTVGVLSGAGFWFPGSYKTEKPRRIATFPLLTHPKDSVRAKLQRTVWHRSWCS